MGQRPKVEKLPTCPSALMISIRRILPLRMHKALDVIRAKSPNPVRDARRMLKKYRRAQRAGKK